MTQTHFDAMSRLGGSVGNSHRPASPRPTTLEKERKLFVDFSSILCLWFEIQAMRTYNIFDWVSNTAGRTVTWPDTVSCIVECPMIDHVRWPITHFVGHPLNHVDDVMRCFCSIFNYWSLVARAANCGIFLLKSNDVQTRNLWEGHFLCAFTYIPSIALAW